MGSDNERLLVTSTPHPTVRVARFIQPDMRVHLDNTESIDECRLFQELRASVLTNLSAGDTVVLNLGLIDWFPTAFYRLLLQVNTTIKAANGRLLMCCLPPLAKEAFDLMGGARTFAGQVSESEVAAIYSATHP